MNASLPPFWRRCVLILALFGFIEISQADTLVSDGFKNNGSTRIEGASLNGLVPETGEGQWLSNAVFAKGDRITVNPAGQDTTGLIAIPVPGSEGTTIQADVRVGDSKWISVGFQDAPTHSNWFNPVTSDLFVILDPEGGWNLYCHGSSDLREKGVIPDFDGNKSYTISLQYTPTSDRSGTAKVSIDGHQVSAAQPVTLPTAIGSAGFLIYVKGSVVHSASVTNIRISSEDL
jgi:hypothetical protein